MLMTERQKREQSERRRRAAAATKAQWHPAKPSIDWTDPAVRAEVYARFLDLLDTVYGTNHREETPRHDNHR